MAREILDDKQIKINITESVRLGFDRCNLIAEMLGERPETVYGLLGDLRREQKLERYEKGGKTYYRLPGAQKAEEAPAEKRPEDLSAREIEEGILAAITEAPRTLTQLKRACKFPMAMDISDRIEKLLIYRQIRGESNGNITAFFLFGKKPKRFWLSGKDYVEAEFDDDFDAEAEEKRVENHRRQIREALEKNESEPVLPARQNGNHGGRRKVVELEEAAVELAASRSTTIEATAAALGIGYSTLLAKMKANPQLRAAYERGKKEKTLAPPGVKAEEESQNLREPKSEIKESENVQAGRENVQDIAKTSASTASGDVQAAQKARQPKKSRGKNVEYTEEMFERFGAEGLNQKQIAERLGRHYTSVCKQLGKPEMRKAFQRGLRRFDDNRMEQALAKLSEDAPSIPSHSAEAVSESRIDIQIIESAETKRSEPEFRAHDPQAFPEFGDVKCRVYEADRQSPIKAAKSIVDAIIEETESEPPSEEIRTQTEALERRAPDFTFVESLDFGDPPPGMPIIVPFNLNYQSGPAEINNQIQTSPETQKTVALGKGSLNLSLEVNLFETTPDEREFLFDLVERVQQFERRKGGAGNE